MNKNNWLAFASLFIIGTIYLHTSNNEDSYATSVPLQKNFLITSENNLNAKKISDEVIKNEEIRNEIIPVSNNEAATVTKDNLEISPNLVLEYWKNRVSDSFSIKQINQAGYRLEEIHTSESYEYFSGPEVNKKIEEIKNRKLEPVLKVGL